MKERPILFSGSMVRAILEGRKTQTRRIIKPQPDIRAVGPAILSGALTFDNFPNYVAKCPYGIPGNRLWVRETWAARPDQDHLPPIQCDDSGLWWRASVSPAATGYEACHGKWRPSIHMPRWASRINLEITNIRAERLQEISEEDAKAEGPSQHPDYPQEFYCSWETAYKALWESINGPGSWDKNPWVWVVEFRRI